MKHYMDIQRLKPAFIDGFEKGDHIVVQEKVDGANFSIRYDAETDTIKAFSRKQELNEFNTLRGAWNWSQTLSKELVKAVLGDRYVLFGEYLVPHSVVYPAECYNKAYFYDLYDTVEERWLPQDEVTRAINELNLIAVPRFYDGEFTSWDNLMSLVGTTKLGGEYGEGIVVKNQTKLNSPNTRLPFYTKIVAERFCETKAHKERKPVSPEELAAREALIAAVESIVTRARVEKILHKFVDEGLLREDWDETDMGSIAKMIGKAVYADCTKEENDTVQAIGAQFGKMANSTAMKNVKVILAERTRI